MRDVHEILKELTPAQRQLFLLRLREREEKKQTETKTGPVRYARETPYLPLSFQQERLFFLNQFEQNNSHYNILTLLRVHGTLTMGILQQCMAEIIKRHEALRTTFVVQRGVPLQVVGEPFTPSPALTDLRVLSPVEQDKIIRQTIKSEQLRAMDLAHGPLLSVYLLWLSDNEHLLFLTVHHSVFDGWSVSIFLKELRDLYEAFCSREVSPLPELPLQYSDFARWQREQLASGQLAFQLAYWKQQLAGDLPVLELPTDRPRPPVQMYQGASQPFQLSSDLTNALRLLCLREGTSLFMTLLAAFMALLHRYTAQDDIIVGTPIANRTGSTKCEQLIGCFINMLALRADLSGNPSFLDFLRTLREIVLEAYSHQDLSFEKLVEELRPARDLSRHPIFQVSFTLQNIPLSSLQTETVTFIPLEYECLTVDYDLECYMREEDGCVKGSFEYNTDLYDAQTIQRMVQHYIHLLEGMVADPSARLWDLPLLTLPEQKQLLHVWNDTTVKMPWKGGLYALFEELVEKTPDALAVVEGEEQLTYRSLSQRSSQLALHLRQRGVQQETLVALLETRSIPFLLAILAIFKAGGAYLPLDPTQPAARLRQILEKSGCELVLYADSFEPKLAQVLAAMPPATHLQRAALRSLLEQKTDEERVFSPAMPGQLAYVIYTSGSTGSPKGVMIEQKGMLNHLYAKITALRLTCADHVAQTASQYFDISVWQFLAALLVGGCVHIIPDEIAHDPLRLAAQVERAHISILETVPSLLSIMLENLERETVPRPNFHPLRWLIPTGEALPSALCRRWLALYPQIPLLNAYGPTECSDDVTHFPLFEPLAANVVHVPIGSPLQNTRLYILDRTLHPQPPGVRGELYVGGVGVGRGYLREAGRTAETFLPDPFSQEPGMRLYKTGDLARYLPNGTIEFLGRVDHQVKVRGYRIELEEIEEALRRLPHVHDAAVWTHEVAPDDKRLVAYVVLQQAVPVNDLYEGLKKTLPAYMIPSAFVLLDRWPLTPNDKLDRNALPIPDFAHSALKESVEAKPRNTLEATVERIWAEILGREHIDIFDNFFMIGGHSLLVMRIVARLREALGVELAPVSLFEAPTIAELSALLASTGAIDAAPPIEPVDRNERLPLSLAQQRFWALDQIDPESAKQTIPLVFRIEGKLDIPVLEESLNEIIRRHEILRTTFVDTDEGPLQRIAPTLTLPIQQIDLSAYPAPAELIDYLCRQEIQRPIDISQGPCLRVTLLHLSQASFQVLFLLHHIIADGWSEGIFFQELNTLYAAFLQGQPSSLAPLPIQFADFAVWQRNVLQGKRFAEHLEYWKRQLHGAPPLSTLPTRQPRPAYQIFQGAQRLLILPAEVISALQALSQRQGVTLHMTLLCSFVILLARYAQQEDIVIGCPQANRHHTILERVIGCFADMLVLRFKLEGDPTFLEALRHVHQVTTEAYTHQDVPLAKIIEVVQPERSSSYNPLFQVLFNYVDLPGDELVLSGAEVSSVQVESGMADVDLFLSIFKQPDDELQVLLEYDTSLFDTLTIETVLTSWKLLLQALIQAPDQPIAQLPLLALPEQRPATLQVRERPGAETATPTPDQERTKEALSIVVASTFTANPLLDVLSFWMARLHITSTIEFAPYSQVFQQLLASDSVLARNQQGINLIVLRVEDWSRRTKETSPDPREIELHSEEFLQALASFQQTQQIPCCLFLCPPSQPVEANPGLRDACQRTHQRLLARVAQIEQTFCLDMMTMLAPYHVEVYHDPLSDTLGHIPYTPEFFAVLGTCIARQFAALAQCYPSVIIVDGDQFAPAQGAGDDVPEASVQVLKTTLMALVRQGRQVALCSTLPHGVPASLTEGAFPLSVWSDTRPLRAKLEAIAQTNNCSLGDCLYLSSNTAACDQVRSNCPEVLVLHHPSEPVQLAAFLAHTWIFDAVPLSLPGDLFRSQNLIALR